MKKLLAHFKTTIGSGLLALIPIGFTLVILKFLFDMIDPGVKNLLNLVYETPNIPGIGIITSLICVYITGLLAKNILGDRVMKKLHDAIEKIPGIKSIYSSARSAIEVVSNSHDPDYHSVVLIDFPRPGTKVLGLMTADLGIISGKPSAAIYVPTTPLPSSGYLLIVPNDEITFTELTVEDAMQVIISGGLLADDLSTRIGESHATNP
tara:strand:- start:6675 stop:7298 length:624 start_codon:yes stop_codon:yes gene_type:complete